VKTLAMVFVLTIFSELTKTKS